MSWNNKQKRAQKFYFSSSSLLTFETFPFISIRLLVFFPSSSFISSLIHWRIKEKLNFFLSRLRRDSTSDRRKNNVSWIWNAWGGSCLFEWEFIDAHILKVQENIQCFSDVTPAPYTANYKKKIKIPKIKLQNKNNKTHPKNVNKTCAMCWDWLNFTLFSYQEEEISQFYAPTHAFTIRYFHKQKVKRWSRK